MIVSTECNRQDHANCPTCGQGWTCECPCHDEPEATEFKTWIIWGQDLEEGDAPKEYAFATQDELTAFLAGVDAAVGWLEHHIVDGPGYKVNENCEIIKA